MAVYTDVPDFAVSLLGAGGEAAFAPWQGSAAPVGALVKGFFGAGECWASPVEPVEAWPHVVVRSFASGSQYERLIALVRAGLEAPHGVACVAGAGSGFRGFRNRSWSAGAGNIHLTVHLAPRRPVPRFETVFMALAAVSVVEAIDGVTGLAGLAGIRWVNDVVIGGAKVGGVLAHSQTRGAEVTSVILGIGVNVETTPSVSPTPFVPSVASVRDFAADRAGVTVGAVLGRVLQALAANYESLLEHGHEPVMERYRSRSAVIGEEVVVSADEPDEVPRELARGRVIAIGDGLELGLAGVERPVTRGRLILPALAGNLLYGVGSLPSQSCFPSPRVP